MARFLLKHLRIERADFVDLPANKFARITLFKRAPRDRIDAEPPDWRTVEQTALPHLYRGHSAPTLERTGPTMLQQKDDRTLPKSPAYEELEKLARQTQEAAGRWDHTGNGHKVGEHRLKFAQALDRVLSDGANRAITKRAPECQPATAAARSWEDASSRDGSR